MYVAKDLGIFKKHGLDASIVVMNPPSAIAALNTGSIQFMGALGSAARAAEKGIPIRVVFVTQNNPAQELMAAPGIKDAKGLANHVIAGETSSSDVNALIYEGLLKSGLKPGSYKIVNAGHEPQQTAFLVSGRAAATPEGQPEIFKLEKQGFHPVVNFSRIIQMPYQGLATSQKYIANDPELIKRVDQASLDAVNVCKNQPQLFEKVMEQEFKMTPAEAQQTFEFLKPTWTSNGRPSTAAIQTEMQLDQQFGKLPKLPQASQVYDFSLLGQG